MVEQSRFGSGNPSKIEASLKNKSEVLSDCFDPNNPYVFWHQEALYNLLYLNQIDKDPRIPFSCKHSRHTNEFRALLTQFRKNLAKTNPQLQLSKLGKGYILVEEGYFDQILEPGTLMYRFAGYEANNWSVEFRYTSQRLDRLQQIDPKAYQLIAKPRFTNNGSYDIRFSLPQTPSRILLSFVAKDESQTNPTYLSCQALCEKFGISPANLANQVSRINSQLDDNKADSRIKKDSNYGYFLETATRFQTK